MLPVRTHLLCEVDLPASQTAPLDWTPSASVFSFLRHSFVLTNLQRDRISNLLSIGFSSRITLRSRLTLGGSTFPRKPWTFGEYDSYILCVTHADILSSIKFTLSFDHASSLIQRSPTSRDYSRSQASVLCLAPSIFGATILDQ